ncbi:MAG: cysteinyl-tRNA synthetase [Methanobacterium sp.]|jgi:cysteinyl-tRNA synthetase|uniref:cysteine--tRNA ligase n=1 Tax=Methanobacterium sp. TaxID=2164 RepID=UPI0003C9BED7|nr:cysteine--tRNA ligase [Methanobacterium sp.]MDI3549781.1 cysteinyl-tRNA synthetase [Methanobacterium sp.]CDG65249.1 Cysteine-tRNA ligase [Methanobacterium sp. MB1]
MIKVYNTLTRKKELFKPRQGNRVKLFVCGPTVYDNSHIGHARTYISFDVIARYLKYKGYSVFYLQNITDVDDKIIKRASETGKDPLELAREFEAKYIEDMETLGVENVNLYARATEHIPEIIAQIETLIDKGFAYETESGVYFDESKFPDFGKLSNRNLEDLNVHRINPDTSKRNPGDFALWKKKDDEPNWDSPWGPGRPGWHIEDTAITEEYFGPQYDIHGGGLDLIFPHHEAEIAQMESASGKKPMVRYWMHTGFLNVKGEKMSKSLGNFITIKDLLEEYPPEVFRFFVLSTHYRSPIDFSQEILEQSQSGLKRIYKLTETIEDLLESDIPENNSHDLKHQELIQETRKNFFEAMDNDFNTPFALSSIFDFIREINRDINESNVSKSILTDVREFINEIGNILGFDFVLNKSQADVSDDLVHILTDVREKLREKKEYELSDEIRSRLKDLDIVIEDRN